MSGNKRSIPIVWLSVALRRWAAWASLSSRPHVTLPRHRVGEDLSRCEPQFEEAHRRKRWSLRRILMSTLPAARAVALTLPGDRVELNMAKVI